VIVLTIQYACSAAQSDICAFLVDHGADIDDEAFVSYVPGQSFSTST
jgi:hypothetical protein